MLNLPKQRQVCPSLFFQFNMRISVIYGTLSVSCKRVVSVLSPLASNSFGGSQLVVSLNFFIHKNFLSSFYLLIFYFEKFSTWTCRLPFAVYSLISTFIMFGNCQNVSEPRKRKFAAIRWTVANYNSVLRAGLEPRTSGAWYESQLPATRPSCRTKIDVWHPHCFWS